GLIDSRLFGAYVPPQIETPRLEELEASSAKDLDVPIETVADLQPTMLNQQPDTGPAVVVPGEVQVPGMIDPRLFGAFVPANLPTPPLETIEYTRFDALVEHDPDGAQAAEEEVIPYGTCPACGVQFRSRTCPECGNPMIPDEEE
ncbi:MAG: hypothetical protein JXR83_19825, partial [Deltaproteobacteria bacterium]|nr:hypothetical protein [Deltaproteobacteria bacterium]